MCQDGLWQHNWAHNPYTEDQDLHNCTVCNRNSGMHKVLDDRKTTTQLAIKNMQLGTLQWLLFMYVDYTLYKNPLYKNNNLHVLIIINNI